MIKTFTTVNPASKGRAYLWQSLKEYPQLKRESIQAALAYAADAVRQEIILPLVG